MTEPVSSARLHSVSIDDDGLGHLELTQPLAPSDLPVHAGLSEPLDAAGRLRVEAHLAIAEYQRILVVDAGPDFDEDAHADALASWIVDRVAEGRREAVAALAGDVEAIELSQAAVVELAAAHSTFVEVAQQAQRIAQIQAIVRQGMTISQSYDLSNTLLEELDKLRGRLAGILGKYPELQQLAAPDVEARSAELQRPDGSPIV